MLNKTIISESMLYPDQVDFYERIYLDNYGFLKENYPEDVVLYIVGLEFDYYQPPAPATQEAIDKLRKKYSKDSQ